MAFIGYTGEANPVNTNVRDAPFSARRIPDFAKLHAREEARIARWKRTHKKEVTIPNGFRLNPTPPNDYTKYVHNNHNVLNGGSSALNAEVNEETGNFQRHPSAPRREGMQARPFSARPSVALLKRPGTAHPAHPQTAHANGASRFVSKVFEAREAGAARAQSPTGGEGENINSAGSAPSSRVGPPTAGVLYPAAFKHQRFPSSKYDSKPQMPNGLGEEPMEVHGSTKVNHVPYSTVKPPLSALQEKDVISPYFAAYYNTSNSNNNHTNNNNSGSINNNNFSVNGRQHEILKEDAGRRVRPGSSRMLNRWAVADTGKDSSAPYGEYQRQVWQNGESARGTPKAQGPEGGGGGGGGGGALRFNSSSNSSEVSRAPTVVNSDKLEGAKNNDAETKGGEGTAPSSRRFPLQAHNIPNGRWAVSNQEAQKHAAETHDDAERIARTSAKLENAMPITRKYLEGAYDAAKPNPVKAMTRPYSEYKMPSSQRAGSLEPSVQPVSMFAANQKELDVSGLQNLVRSIGDEHVATLHQPFSSVDFYTFGRTLGEGAYGKVKLGTHRLTGEMVAIKTFEKSKLTEPTARKRVAREVRILKALCHPNIIRLFEVVDAPYRQLLIMQYSSGGDLCKYVRENRRLHESEASRLFAQIVDGLQYCHSCGIVHRDVKLDNLLMDQDKNIKIVDFGFSVSFKPGQRLRKACGSPSYAAPEIVARKPYLAPCVDVWSTGVVLFAMVCGYFPFQGANSQELCRKIMKGKFECPTFMSSECRDLVRRMLNIDPARRITFEECSQHVWCRKSFDTVAQQKSKEKAPPSFIDCELSVDSVNRAPVISVDQDLLRQVVDLGFDPHFASRSVAANRHNICSASYWLLHHKVS
mmetsp:Transcript_48544/g.152251  ORF Transcript_48544/g.152251 Transcript_48544/m.152251 type:complete len:868 (-) Transcript_48544:170-2773(-)